MRRFIEKFFIILFCLYNSYKTVPTANLALYFLISIIISLTLDLFNDKKIRSVIYIYKPNLILMDIRMEKMNGIDATKNIMLNIDKV